MKYSPTASAQQATDRPIGLDAATQHLSVAAWAFRPSQDAQKQPLANKFAPFAFMNLAAALNYFTCILQKHLVYFTHPKYDVKELLRN